MPEYIDIKIGFPIPYRSNICQTDPILKAKDTLIFEPPNQPSSWDREIERVRPGLARAEGPGALTSGGFGGEVIHVTTTEDTQGPGSFRWAIEQPYKRHIVFDLDGTFRGVYPFMIPYSEVTIDGTDHSVTIEGGLEIFNQTDVILTEIRFDQLQMKSALFVVVDRTSSQRIDVDQSRNITIQQSLMTTITVNETDRIGIIKNILVGGQIRTGPGKVAIINNFFGRYPGVGVLVLITHGNYRTSVIVVGNIFDSIAEGYFPNESFFVEAAPNTIPILMNTRIYLYDNRGYKRSRATDPQAWGLRTPDQVTSTKPLWNVCPVQRFEVTEIKTFLFTSVGPLRRTSEEIAHLESIK